MLTICKNFFNCLNVQNIRYCHWKSNSHLKKALNGETDLDLLVHIDNKEQFEFIMEKFFIKKMMSPPAKQFPGVEDFLGFDEETGAFIHLHIHYRLVLGQKYIKNHHLPIEALIFRNLIQKFNVNIPCPELELLLLIIRAHMKLDIISVFKHGIKEYILKDKQYTAFPVDIENEFTMLIQDINHKKFETLFFESRLPINFTLFTEFIAKFSLNDINFYKCICMRRTILSSLSQYRRKKTKLVYWNYFISFIKEFSLFRKFFNTPKKTFPDSGKIFSIIGADGSGKSTLIQDLEKWLGWKLSVVKYYYGIPKNTIIKTISFLIRGLKKIKLEFIANFVEYNLWVAIAKYRLNIAFKARQKIKKGKVVITDRFPLKIFQKMNEPMDGPRLSKVNTKIGEYYSKVEKKYYNQITLPNKIFVLKVSIDELRRRKTDLGYLDHIKKSKAVNSIKHGKNLVIIDANKLYPEVLLTIKKEIWSELCDLDSTQCKK